MATKPPTSIPFYFPIPNAFPALGIFNTSGCKGMTQCGNARCGSCVSVRWCAVRFFGAEMIGVMENPMENADDGKNMGKPWDKYGDHTRMESGNLQNSMENGMENGMENRVTWDWGKKKPENPLNGTFGWKHVFFRHSWGFLQLFWSSKSGRSVNQGLTTEIHSCYSKQYVSSFNNTYL